MSEHQVKVHLNPLPVVVQRVHKKYLEPISGCWLDGCSCRCCYFYHCQTTSFWLRNYISSECILTTAVAARHELHRIVLELSRQQVAIICECSLQVTALSCLNILPTQH